MKKNQIVQPKEENQKVLLINDIAGYGKVSLAAMIPIMSHMGFSIFNLPTAIVSNTLDYGLFDILETTNYMKNTLEVWRELGFSFDAICTGFIVSEEQVRVVADYCSKQKKRGTRIFVDPIMGDDGKLYNGVSNNTITYMRQICSVADIIMPNYTEACFLADKHIGKATLTEEEAKEVVDTLRELGSKSVIITSITVDGGTCVFGYDYDNQEYFKIPFEYVPVHFPGTGDIFSALLIGSVLKGISLQESTADAMRVVRELILLNTENVDKYKGIPIEKYLDDMISFV
jgi:pyridoxine kinase